MREARTPVFAAGERQLTPRQADVLRQLMAGCSYHEAAASLGLSRDTVSVHIKNIHDTLQVSTTVQAVVRAIATGVFTLEDVQAADRERQEALA